MGTQVLAQSSLKSLWTPGLANKGTNVELGSQKDPEAGDTDVEDGPHSPGCFFAAEHVFAAARLASFMGFSAHSPSQTIEGPVGRSGASSKVERCAQATATSSDDACCKVLLIGGEREIRLGVLLLESLRHRWLS